MALTIGQEKAFDAVKSGKNVFITGGGGVGKSYLTKQVIHCLKKSGKTVLATASTGIAATLIDGVTCHRALQIPISMTWTASPNVGPSSPIYLADSLLIDEISMIRMDVFDFIVRTIENVNEIRKSPEYLADPKNTHRDPIQLIVVGDFSQLPPVLKLNKDGPSARDLMNTYYGFDIGSAYAFRHPCWDRCHFIFCELTEVVRQADPETATAFNAIRIGYRSALRYLKEKSKKEDFPPDEEGVVMLCGKNKTAERLNSTALARLPGRAKDYFADVWGTVTEQDKVAPDTISLKVGAHVIMLQNTEKYVNGSCGVITRLMDRCVFVLIDDTGEEVAVPYATWNIEKYVVINEDGEKTVGKEVIGRFSQLPLRLSYAITIHKAQGQTFDKVVLVLGSDDKKKNAKSILPEIFAYGQFYVAISRVKNIKNLRIKGDIDLIEKLADPEVIEFYKRNDSVIFSTSTADSKVPESEDQPPKDEKIQETKTKKKRHTKKKADVRTEESFASIQCPKNIAPLVLIFSTTLSPESRLVAGTELRVPRNIEKQVSDYIEMLN